MDAGGANTCIHCGQTNPAHGLWCSQCDKPLSQPIVFSTAGHSHLQGKTLAAKISLYNRVLEDLGEMANHGEIPVETLSTIETFYQDRLAKKRVQSEMRQRGEELEKYANTAQTLAHASAGRFQEAMETLTEGIRKFPEEAALSEMLEELRLHVEKRERTLLAQKKARDLFSTARMCLGRLQFGEAVEKLQEALTYDPHNKAILDTLAQARLQCEREEEQRHSPAPQEPEIPAMAVVCLKPDELGPEPAVSPAPSDVAEVADVHRAPVPPIAPTFAEEEIPSPTQRWIEAASHWSKVFKPLLLDNAGWFIGVFLVVAGFVVLITTFWQTLEENRLLMLSLVFFSLFTTTGAVFTLAYFLRVRHPELETSSNVLLIIVALLIPLVFATAAMTTLLPAA